MNHTVSEELISAYIDGEVTTDERAIVERALADSPELRRLHQDLQDVQHNLRSLPRHRLPTDFSLRVTARIERESLRPLPIDHPAVAASVERGRSPGHRAWRSWHTAATVAASLAAVLLLAALVVSYRHRPEELPGSSFVAANSDRGGTSASSRDHIAPSSTNAPAPIVQDGARAPRDMTRQVGTSDANQAPSLVMVMDLALTPKGRADRVFEDALKRAGIPFDPDIRVDDRLEKALLASRFLGDVQVVERNSQADRNAAADEIEMAFVTGPGLRIDAAMKDLQSRPVESIARWQYDLAIEPAEKDLFRLLDSAVRLAGAEESAPRAYRLVFRFSLRQASTGFMGTMARPLLRVELEPDMSTLPQRAAAPHDAAPADGTHVLPAVAPGLANADSEAAVNPDDELCKVLFILRSSPDASPRSNENQPANR